MNNIYKTILLCCCIFCFSDLLAQKPVDRKASKQTKNLYKNLSKLSETKILFGHQDDLAYGVGWKYQDGRSDIKDVTGEYPSIYGWEIAGLEKDSPINIDSVPFLKMQEYIRQVYDRGGVNTISWHLDNPSNGKTAWDTTRLTVPLILQGGKYNGIYNLWLDKVAVFLKQLKGSDGKAIPIIFRPFHELSGSWFWWGKNQCSPDEYKKLWQYTANYLSEKKNVHNLLYAYNMADFTSRQEYLERYPGDEYVDIMSFDAYQFTDPITDNTFTLKVDKQLSIQDSLSKEHNKIPAFAETGYEAVPYSEWWTKVLAKTIGNHRIAYVLVWRNAGFRPEYGKFHYYAPFKGQASETDFIKFYNLDKMIFQEKISQHQIYRKKMF